MIKYLKIKELMNVLKANHKIIIVLKYQVLYKSFYKSHRKNLGKNNKMMLIITNNKNRIKMKLRYINLRIQKLYKPKMKHQNHLI